MTPDLLAFVRELFTREDLPGHGMQRVDHGEHIVRALGEALERGVEGDVVELGCNAGLTAVLLQATLDAHASHKRLHVFDSFEGLPPKSTEDGATAFEAGGCASPPEVLLNTFRRFGRRLPVIHPGWFSHTLRELPPQIAFAHLDADFYSSTIEALREVYPRLASGATVVLHDYYDPTTREGVPEGVRVEDYMDLPGVHRACAEFLADKKERPRVLLFNGWQNGQGILRKD